MVFSFAPDRFNSGRRCHRAVLAVTRGAQV
jgi:hypothetical protein